MNCMNFKLGNSADVSETHLTEKRTRNLVRRSTMALEIDDVFQWSHHSAIRPDRVESSIGEV